MANQGEHKEEELKTLMEIMLRREAKIAKKEEELEEKQKVELAQRVKELNDNAAHEESVKRAKRNGCPHAIQNQATGKATSAWRAQVNADGCFRPTCCICQTEMPKIKATENMIREGVNLHAYPVLAPSQLEAWHKKDFPDGCGTGSCHVCSPVKTAVAV